MEASTAGRRIAFHHHTDGRSGHRYSQRKRGSNHGSSRGPQTGAPCRPKQVPGQRTGSPRSAGCLDCRDDVRVPVPLPLRTPPSWIAHSGTVCGGRIRRGPRRCAAHSASGATLAWNGAAWSEYRRTRCLSGARSSSFSRSCAPDAAALLRRASSSASRASRWAGIVSALHVVIRVAGAVVVDEMVKPAARLAGRLSAAVGDAASRARERATRKGGRRGRRDRRPERRAALHAHSRRRISCPGTWRSSACQLEARCIVYPPTPRGNSKVPGPLSGPTCTAPGDVHHGDLPVARRAAAAPRDVRPELADERARSCKPRERRTARRSRSAPGSRTTCRCSQGPDAASRSRPAGRSSHLDRDAHEEPEAGRYDDEDRGHPARHRRCTIPPTTLAFTYSPDEGGLLQALRHPISARQRGDRLQAVPRKAARRRGHRRPIRRAPRRRRRPTCRSPPR